MLFQWVILSYCLTCASLVAAVPAAAVQSARKELGDGPLKCILQHDGSCQVQIMDILIAMGQDCDLLFTNLNNLLDRDRKTPLDQQTCSLIGRMVSIDGPCIVNLSKLKRANNLCRQSNAKR